MKRYVRFTVIGAIVLLVIQASCSALSSFDTSDLANSIGSSPDGPGSGNWNPPTPANRNQCEALYEIETELARQTSNLLEQYPNVKAICYDDQGNWLASDDPACNQPIEELASQISDYFSDFDSGRQPYEDVCIEAGAPYLPPISGAVCGPGECLGFEGCSTDCKEKCLTCTYKIHNREYVFFDLNVKLP